MSTSLTSRTTISSRNKILAHQENGGNREIFSSQNQNKIRASMQPPSQIARNRALQTPAPPSAATLRLANLANGLPSSIKERSNTIMQNVPSVASTTAVTPKVNMRSASPAGITQTSSNSSNNNKTSFPVPANKLPPHTTARLVKQTTRALAPSTSSRIMAPGSSLTNAASLNSRSSSMVSSVSSAAASKRPSVSAIPADSRQSSIAASNHIPDTNLIRKGLAKFSNPIECQRQFQALGLKVRQKEEIVEAREKEIYKLLGQLRCAVNIGAGYATAVQYFAAKLRLGSDTNLLQEHEQLKCRVEHDLRHNLEKELKETHNANCQSIQNLKDAHKNELDDLNEKHSTAESELQNRINILESELATKGKELADLRKEHEVLNNNYNKLEESLTKDKDARVKYLQEKINQLQKDVESLNSVMEMRQERVHTLERDSLLLAEAQNELITQKDTNKALNQQLESLNAALVKKREQYENLIVEHEKIRQELKRERKERRRMTMRTEQLEFVLNESCASESNMVFNSSIRDIDSADHLV